MAQKARIEEYADGNVTIYNLRNNLGVPVFGLNEMISASRVTQYWDGTPMDESKVDNKLYLQLKSLPDDTNPDLEKYIGDYFKVNLPYDGELFLEKDTMAQMRSLSSVEIILIRSGFYKGVRLNGYKVKGDTPSPIDYVLNETPGQIDDGGSVISMGSVSLYHDFGGYVHVSYFGAVEGDNEDNTSVYDNIVNYCGPNDTIEWYPGKVYRGSFVSNKPLTLLVNYSTLLSTGVDPAVIRFEGDIISDIRSATSSMSYGDSVVSLNSVLGISEGDLITVRDQKARPDGSRVNFETLKVKTVNTSNNSVEVYDMVRSYQNQGVVDVEVIKPISNILVKDIKIRSQNSHWGHQLDLEGVENARVENLETFNNVGNALRIRKSYNVTTQNIIHNKPRLNGGGQGYGSATVYSRFVYMSNVTGYEMRHVIDNNCIYCTWVDGVKDFYSNSAIQLCHNLYGGNIHYKNITVEGQSYAALHAQSQGISGTNGHILRDVSIDNVTHIMKTVSSTSGGETSVQSSVRLEGSLANVRIVNIKAINNVPGYENDMRTGNSVVYLASSSIFDDVDIKNIVSNRIGTGVFHSRGSAPTTATTGLLKVSGLRLDSATQGLQLSGTTRVKLNEVYLIGSGATCVANIGGGANLAEAYLDSIRTNSSTPLFNIQPSNLLFGHYLKNGGNSNNSATTVFSGTTFARSLIESKIILKLTHDFSGDLTMSSPSVLPDPNFWGEELIVEVNTPQDFGQKGAVIIPDTNTNVINDQASNGVIGNGVTIRSGEIVRLLGSQVGSNKVWRVERFNQMASSNVAGIVRASQPVEDISNPDLTTLTATEVSDIESWVNSNLIPLVNSLKSSQNNELTNQRSSGQQEL